MKPVRVLVVDDSPLFRDMLRLVLEDDPDLKVVGEAQDGEQAIEQVQSLQPDLVTVDLAMPGMGGLETIEQLMAHHPVPILVISGQPAVTDGHGVFEAIARGALEIVEKGRVNERDGKAIRSLVRRLASVRVVRHVKFNPSLRPRRPTPAPVSSRRDLFAVAASSGGPSTVVSLLSALPDNFPACIAVVQHLPIGFTAAFARFLREHLELQVAVVTRPMPPAPGWVLLAPDDRHLVFVDHLFTPSSAPAVGGHRPSATMLFRSLVPVAPRTVGVILTGMGEDGVAGLRELRDAGGLTLAQDQKTSAVFGMPKAALEQGAAGQALGLTELAQAMMRAAPQEIA
jgi:two-component system chemotaxis response regulator CheB